MRGTPILALIVLVALVGCAPASGGAAPATSTPAESPIASPMQTTGLSAIVISATGMALLGDDGTQEAAFDFLDDDPADFAHALAVAAGVDPMEATTPGGFEGAQFTTKFDWQGLQISTAFSPGQCQPDCRGTVVHATAPSLAGMPIRTASGITVGDSIEDAQKLGAQPTSEIPLAAEPEDPALFGSTTTPTRVVILDLDASATQITDIRASGSFTTFGNI